MHTNFILKGVERTKIKWSFINSRVSVVKFYCNYIEVKGNENNK